MRYYPSLEAMYPRMPAPRRVVPSGGAPGSPVCTEGNSHRSLMDVRQLEALLAVAEEGTFTAAADRCTRCSRTFPGMYTSSKPSSAYSCSSGAGGARCRPSSVSGCSTGPSAIRSELEALHKDLSMLQGLETGHATLGVVGTVSRSLVPALVVEMRRRRARLVAAAHRRRVGAARGRGCRTPARERGRDRTRYRSASRSSSTSATKTSSAWFPSFAPARRAGAGARSRRSPSTR